jgi:uncharacterized membrane protein
VEILLALGAAVSYGASDFTGGLLSRTTRVLVVVLLSQLVSFALLLGAVPFWGAEFSQSAIAWGVAAGLAGASGASLLYRGLAIGRMSVVAPISGVLAAGLPVVFGLAVGERPGPTALTGVVLGIIAVVVITRAEGPADATDHEPALADAARQGGRGIGEAFGAGSGFGLFFILLERSPGDSGLWPLVGTRISMLLAIGLLVAFRRIPLDFTKRVGRRLVALGVINVLADLLFLLATRRGLLSLVAVITSMYPAATVILARSILSEQMVGQQMIGLAIAAASVGLIASG